MSKSLSKPNFEVVENTPTKFYYFWVPNKELLWNQELKNRLLTY